MGKVVDALCECDLDACMLEIKAPVAVMIKKVSNNHIIIIDGCRKGPSEGDVLVTQHDGYGVYIPKKD